jgi:hypothetical protein
MKKSNVGMISAFITIIVGVCLGLLCVATIFSGYTNIGGLWNDNMIPDTIINTEMVFKDAPAKFANNLYVKSSTEFILGLWNATPVNFKPLTLGGLWFFMSTPILLAGFLCVKRKAKVAFLIFGIIESLVTLGLISTVALLLIGGCEVVLILGLLSLAIAYAVVFPVFKFCGYASFDKRANEKKLTPVVQAKFPNAISHNSKKKKKHDKAITKKVSKKEKQLIDTASSVGKTVNAAGKIISKPVTISQIKAGENTGIAIQGFNLNKQAEKKTTNIATKKKTSTKA